MYARLFTAIALAAAFDDMVKQAANNGRVEHTFATLASTELGLPTLKADGKPVGKPAFLTLASEYREQVRFGKRAGFAKRAQRVDIGVALDAIAAALDPQANVIGDFAAWMTATEPKPTTSKVKAVATPKAAPAPVASSEDDAPVDTLAHAPDSDRYDEGFAAGQASNAVELTVPDLLAGMLDALQAQALTHDELATLALYVADAQRAMVAEDAAMAGDMGAATLADAVALGQADAVDVAAPVAAPVAQSEGAALMASLGAHVADVAADAFPALDGVPEADVAAPVIVHSFAELAALLPA